MFHWHIVKINEIFSNAPILDHFDVCGYYSRASFIGASMVVQGVLRLIWSGRLECVFVDPKGARISKNGNKITCRLSKNKHFLFYTQGRGRNIMPATTS